MKLRSDLRFNSCCKQAADINHYQINIDYTSLREHFIQKTAFAVQMSVVLSVPYNYFFPVRQQLLGIIRFN